MVAVEVRRIALRDLAEARAAGPAPRPGSRTRARPSSPSGLAGSCPRRVDQAGQPLRREHRRSAGEREVQADAQAPGARAPARSPPPRARSHHQRRAGHDAARGARPRSPRLIPEVRPKSSAFTISRLLVHRSSRSNASATAPARRLDRRAAPAARRLQVERAEHGSTSDGHALNAPPGQHDREGLAAELELARDGPPRPRAPAPAPPAGSSSAAAASPSARAPFHERGQGGDPVLGQGLLVHLRHDLGHRRRLQRLEDQALQPRRLGPGRPSARTDGPQRLVAQPVAGALVGQQRAVAARARGPSRRGRRRTRSSRCPPARRSRTPRARPRPARSPRRSPRGPACGDRGAAGCCGSRLRRAAGPRPRCPTQRAAMGWSLGERLHDRVEDLLDVRARRACRGSPRPRAPRRRLVPVSSASRPTLLRPAGVDAEDVRSGAVSRHKRRCRPGCGTSRCSRGRSRPRTGPRS